MFQRRRHRAVLSFAKNPNISTIFQRYAKIYRSVGEGDIQPWYTLFHLTVILLRQLFNSLPRLWRRTTHYNRSLRSLSLCHSIKREREKKEKSRLKHDNRSNNFGLASNWKPRLYSSIDERSVTATNCRKQERPSIRKLYKNSRIDMLSSGQSFSRRGLRNS